MNKQSCTSTLNIKVGKNQSLKLVKSAGIVEA